MAMVALHTSYQLRAPPPPLWIGVSNVIVELLQDLINDHTEIYAPGEESIRMAVPALKQIIVITANPKQRYVWDKSDEGTWKTLKHAVATHQKRQWLIVASKEDVP